MNNPMTCKEALLLLLDQVDFTAGACSLTDMVGQCVPDGVFGKCRAAIAAEQAARPEAREWTLVSDCPPQVGQAIWMWFGGLSRKPAEGNWPEPVLNHTSTYWMPRVVESSPTPPSPQPEKK